MDREDLANRFTYHPPRHPGAVLKHEEIRGQCGDLADVLNEILPECREKALATTHLEEVMMWANAAVARHPELVG